MSSTKILIPSLLTLIIAAYMTTFFVGQSQRALKFRLGEIVKSDFTPGIHFKLPFVNNVKKFDARILTLDSRPERFLTSEKKNVIVDSFVKWRVGDVELFYTTVGGDELQANLRLDQVMKDAMRSEFGLRTIKQLVSEDRGDLRTTLMKKLGQLAEDFGIELIDVRIKRIDLPKKVSNSVYSRMESERERVAHEFRSQGSEATEQISATADKNREVILANAYREAEKIRGLGDAKAAEIYAASYSKNEEFYAFHRALSAYDKSFKNTQDVMVLEPKSDFFKYFSNEN